MSCEVKLRHSFGAFSLAAEFTLEPGVTALFGPSGAGKTTIINAVAGLMKPDEGRIIFDGETLLDATQGHSVPARARRIGVVFQDARLFPHLTVRGNLLYGWRRKTGRADDATIAEIVSLLDLGGLLNRRPRTLSGGEKGRVALGRALLAAPRALMMDEPLASLDVARKGEILPYLERLAHETKIPLLYVSHSIDEVARLANRIVILSEGRIRAAGSLSNVMSRLDLFTGKDRIIPGALLDATIESHDRAHALTTLTFAGGRLIVPHVAGNAGDKIRIRIDGEDVMLALVEPKDVSANNVFPAIIAAMEASEGTYADVQLALGEAKLVARITRRSAERLRLAPGERVFAIIKSVTVGERIRD